MNATNNTHHEFRFKSEDGLQIAYSRWPSRGPTRGVIQIAHGLGEHIGRYERFRFKENSMTRGTLFRILVTATAFLLCVNLARPDEVRRLTLSEAVHLAVEQNRTLKIARLRVKENQERKAGARSSYFPTITNQSNALHISELQNIVIPPGSLGTAAGASIPPQSISVEQGKNTLVSSGTMIAQPLTQLLRIHQENRIAAAEVATSRDELKNAEDEIALQVHTLYFGILVAQLQKKAAEQETSFASESLRENGNDVRGGSALQVAEIQSRAELLQGQQSVLTAELQIEDYMTELNDLLGLPLDTKLELDTEVATNFATLPKAEYVKTAWEENPEIRAAEEAVTKARAAVAAAKTAYIPDITAYARHSYQDGVQTSALSWSHPEEGQCDEAQADADRQSLDASVESARRETFGALGEPAGLSLTSRQFRWLPQPKRGQRLAIEMPNRDRREFANATQSHCRLARGCKKWRGIVIDREHDFAGHAVFLPRAI
jgi:outer membrane protein TolC